MWPSCSHAMGGKRSDAMGGCSLWEGSRPLAMRGKEKRRPLNDGVRRWRAGRKQASKRRSEAAAREIHGGGRQRARSVLDWKSRLRSRQGRCYARGSVSERGACHLRADTTSSLRGLPNMHGGSCSCARDLHRRDQNERELPNAKNSGFFRLGWMVDVVSMLDSVSCVFPLFLQ